MRSKLRRIKPAEIELRSQRSQDYIAHESITGPFFACR
jgi:hypothetical protein